jgi:hypothetical protein
VPRYKVAHIREQSVDLIIIPLESAFGNKTIEIQQATIDELQAHASAAGLAGTVVPVWKHGRDTKFVAPPNSHPFFRSLSYDRVIAMLNREIYW